MTTVWILLAVFAMGSPPRDYAVASVYRNEAACRLELTGWRTAHPDRALFLCVPVTGMIPVIEKEKKP